jgi:hypothetical protein
MPLVIGKDVVGVMCTGFRRVPLLAETFEHVSATIGCIAAHAIHVRRTLRQKRRKGAVRALVHLIGADNRAAHWGELHSVVNSVCDNANARTSETTRVDRLLELLHQLANALDTLASFPDVIQFSYDVVSPNPERDAKQIRDILDRYEIMVRIKDLVARDDALTAWCTACRVSLFEVIAPRYWRSVCVPGTEVGPLISSWIGEFIKTRWESVLSEKRACSKLIRDAWRNRSTPGIFEFEAENAASGMETRYYIDGITRRHIMDIVSNVVHRAAPIGELPGSACADMWYAIECRDAELIITFWNECHSECGKPKRILLNTAFEQNGGKTSFWIEPSPGPRSAQLAKTRLHIPPFGFALSETLR